MSDHTLPDDVILRTSKAIEEAIMRYGETVGDYDEREEADAVVAATLPILIPAIETALLERMIANLEGAKKSVLQDTVIDWLRTYLPEVTPNGR